MAQKRNFYHVTLKGKGSFRLCGFVDAFVIVACRRKSLGENLLLIHFGSQSNPKCPQQSTEVHGKNF